MRTLFISAPLFSAILVSCSGSGVNHAGSVVLGIQATGLGDGKLLTLVQHYAADTVTVTANGEYRFRPSSGKYLVTVTRQPVGQRCMLANDTGSLTSGDTPPVLVTCRNTAITIGGIISGLLAGETAILRYNGEASLAVTANGYFTFPTPVPFGSTYHVTVSSPMRCTTSDDYGVATATVTSVRVTC